MKRSFSVLGLVVLLMWGCQSAKPGPCDCANVALPNEPGDPAFVTKRQALVSCFLNARSAAMAGTLEKRCDNDMETTLSRDVTELKTLRGQLETLKATATGSAKSLIERNVAQVDAALKNEQQYVGAAPPPEPVAETSCACPDTQSIAQRETALATISPDDPTQFIAARKSVTTCITTLREIALSGSDLPCKNDIKKLEGMLTAEVKSLIEKRDAIPAELAKMDADDDKLGKRLTTVKKAIVALQPLVDVAGAIVTVKPNEFSKRRDKQELLAAEVAFENQCVSDLAFLTISTHEEAGKLIQCVDVQRVRCLNIKENANKCEGDLSKLEIKLREYAGDQFARLNELKAATEPNADQIAEKKKIEETLEKIRKHDIIPDEGDLPEYNDYRQWWSKFGLGYEYTNLNRAFTQGNPRIGTVIGLGLPRQAVPSLSQRNWHPKSYGVFLSFAIGLTNTAEQTKTTFAPGIVSAASKIASDADPDPNTSPEPKNTLAFEHQIFWPLWRSDLHPQDRRLRTWFGPVFLLGGRKADDKTDTFLKPRIYGGVRFARSPEMFSDFVVGKSGGWSRRVELRGQMPLAHRFGNGARIVIGGVGNFGINKRKNGRDCVTIPADVEKCRTHPMEPDAVTFYLSYDIVWGDVLKYFTK